MNYRIRSCFVKFETVWKSNSQDVRKLVEVELVYCKCLWWSFGGWFEIEIEFQWLLCVERCTQCKNVRARLFRDYPKGPPRRRQTWVQMLPKVECMRRIWSPTSRRTLGTSSTSTASLRGKNLELALRHSHVQDLAASLLSQIQVLKGSKWCGGLLGSLGIICWLI